MKILHTSDWHVGKVLKGVPRIEEQQRVLANIVELAGDVDLVLVAGDLFETAAPTPEAQEVAFKALLGLRASGAEVVVIAGNHDSGRSLEAVSSVFAAAGIHLLGQVHRPEDGGVIDLEAGGERVLVACVPFLSQRWVVRAADLMDGDAAQHAGDYAERCRLVIKALCDKFEKDTVNLVIAHGMVQGGMEGGGERKAQTLMDYWIDRTAFPPTAQYVALGHLHRNQKLSGPAPLWYCGSPIQIDFGEEDQEKAVNLIEVHPGSPAVVTPTALKGVRRLRTLEGTMDELRAFAGEAADDLLRVIVNEPASAGLAEAVRELLPNAIDVHLAQREETKVEITRRQGRNPQELFAEYLFEQGVGDDRLGALFARLLDEELTEAASEP